MFEIEEKQEHDKKNIEITITDEDFKERLYEYLKHTDGGCHVYDSKEGILRFSVAYNSDGQRNLFEELKGIKDGNQHPNLKKERYFSVLVENLQRMGNGVEHETSVF